MNNSLNQNFKYYSSSKDVIKKNNLQENIESDIKSKNLNTNQKPTINHKLLDFISDKSKLRLKSCFDHKGSKKFLDGKKEALEKIELNEFILDEENKNINNNKNDEKKNKNYNNNLHSIKFNSRLKDKNRNKLDDINNISNNSSDTEEIMNSETSKNGNKFMFKEKKEKKVKIQKEEDSAYNNANLETDYNINLNKNHKKLYEKRKNKKYLKKKENNFDLSIDSQITVNSKLFNNHKEYQNSKKMISNGDLPFYEEILSELKSKKNN